MSRIILLSNLLPSLDVSLIEQAILSIVSPIKGLNARSLQSTLSVPIVFFDSRDARSVFDYLSAHPSALNSLSNDKVVVQIISTNQLLRQFGPSPFLDSIDPSFHLRVHPPFNLSVVQNLLTSFGDLQTLTPLSQKILDSQNYHIEYFDSRDADRAISQLDGHIWFGMSFTIDKSPCPCHFPSDQEDDDWEGDDEDEGDGDDSKEKVHTVEFPTIADTCKNDQDPTIGPPGSVSNLRVRFQTLAIESEPTVLYASDHTSTTPPKDAICCYCPPSSHYDYTPNLVPSPAPPATAPLVDICYPGTPVNSTVSYEYLEPYGISPASPAPSWGAYDMMRVQMGIGVMPFPHPHMGIGMGMQYAHGHAYSGGYPGPPYNGVPRRMQSRFGSESESGSSVESGRRGDGMSYRRGGVPSFGSGREGRRRDRDRPPPPPPSSPPPPDINLPLAHNPTPTPTAPVISTERNQLNVSRIEEGMDTRTTVMIKNIPNKMSDQDLMRFIEAVCPKRIDFFYLRMDFQNGCNVGYAFVNFIHVKDLLKFAKARLGVKWNIFSSEKVLQMSYANYQGKEALVEKFKNSAIMDEREAWRPRIFYSSGEKQGLAEPFPGPTHLRRKERSFGNKGAFFGGGVGNLKGGLNPRMMVSMRNGVSREGEV